MDFDQLSAEAQETAVANVRDRMAGQWWESDDSHQVGMTILFSFATSIKAPFSDSCGEGDFPGIVNVELTGWTVDGNNYATFAGWLTPDNAPALPWTEALDRVILTGERTGTVIAPETHWQNDNEATPAEIDAMEQAVRDAINDAISAGVAEYEYKTGDEVARDYAENNAFISFDEDGDIIDE